MQINEFDICEFAAAYNLNQQEPNADFEVPDKAVLQKALKSLGESARGLKMSDHYCKKILKVVQHKCSCIPPTQ